MTNSQLYLAIGIPILTNAAMLLLIYTALNQRMNDLKEMWRSELRRVEEVLDARLKHLEER